MGRVHSLASFWCWSTTVKVRPAVKPP